MTDWIVGGLCALLTLVVLGVIGFLIYDAAVAETFELRKDSWRCTQSHVEFMTTYTQVGSVQVQQIVPTNICDQWSRK